MFFKATAKKSPEGNYNIATTCPKGHTSYKKQGGTSNEYVCPHCGYQVP